MLQTYIEEIREPKLFIKQHFAEEPDLEELKEFTAAISFSEGVLHLK